MAHEPEKEMLLMKMKIQVYCAVFVLLLFPLLFNHSDAQASKKAPKAIKGIIDLSDWDFKQDGPIKLDGEWEFYWNRFLSPADFEDLQREKPRYIKVPSIWNAEREQGGRFPEYGFGTYRLTLLVNSKDSIYAVKMGEVLTAYKIWVGGEAVFLCGVPGRDRKRSVPKYMTHVTAFKVDDKRFDIIVQVSNFHYKDGGLRDVVEFGLVSQLQEKREWSLISNYTLFGGVLIMAVYHFGLFGLRREDKSTLLFGLFCLIMASRILVSNEIYLVALFPDAGWIIRLKILVFGYYIGLPVFAAYIYMLYSQEYNRLIIGFILIIGFSFSLMVLLSPPAIFIETEFFYQIFIVLSSLYILYGLSKAVFRKRDGAKLVIFGILILFGTVLNDVLYAQYIFIFSNYQSLVPLGLFFFIFCQSYILSVRFSNAFKIANIDELSQVFNRRRFVELAEQEIQRSERNEKPVCILSIDADRFKSINDAHGHDIGDEVLKSLAATFKDNIRKFDIFGRIGGEEFALLLPETDLQQALRIAERLCKIVETTSIPTNIGLINITVSIGAAGIDELEAVSLERLFKNADLALYKAKNNGRNRVEAWRRGENYSPATG